MLSLRPPFSPVELFLGRPKIVPNSPIFAPFAPPRERNGTPGQWHASKVSCARNRFRLELSDSLTYPATAWADRARAISLARLTVHRAKVDSREEGDNEVALSQVPQDLIEASQRGDKDKIEELIRLITPDLYRILFSMLRDHDDTDEVLQETLIRLFRYIGSLKDIQRFPAWVMRIAVNQVQTHRVRKGRTRFYEIENSSEVSNSAVVMGGVAPDDPREKMVREQLREEISTAMAALPERQRMATVLFEIEGLSIREVAAALQCSEGAVKFNIHEGRKKLKNRLFHLVREMRWGRRRAMESGTGSGWSTGQLGSSQSASGSMPDSQLPSQSGG